MYDNPSSGRAAAIGGLAVGQQIMKQAETSSPVQQTLDSLASAQNMLSDRLDALASRLDPLLGGAIPETAGGSQAGKLSASPFDEVLQYRVNHEWRHIERIEDLLRRLSI